MRRVLPLVLIVILMIGVRAPSMAAEAARVPLPAPQAGTTLAVGIKQLGYFDYNPMQGGGIPADVLALSGSRVRMQGTITPWQQGECITAFALTDGEGCCFGRPPMIQHVIVVSYPAGLELAAATKRVTVEGILRVAEKKSDGWVTGLFTLEASSVTVEPGR